MSTNPIQSREVNPTQGYRRPRDVIHGVVVLIAGVILLLAIAQMLGAINIPELFFAVTAIATTAMIAGLIAMAGVEQNLRNSLDEAQKLADNLYTQQHQRAEQLATLNQVSALLTGSLSPDEVLDTIVSSASTISDARAVAVYLIDEAHPLSAPKLARSAGLSDDLLTLLPHPMMPTAPSEDTLIVPPRTLSDIRTANLRPTLEGALVADGLHAVIELPMLINQEELGAIALYYGQTQVFEEGQIDLLQAYTTQAAQAIANAYSYTHIDQALERRVEQLYSLASLGRVINASLDEATIYATVTRFAQQGTESERVALMMLDENGVLVLQHRVGDIPQGWGKQGECELIAQAMQLSKGDPVRINDLQGVSASDPVARKILTAAYDGQGRSLLVVPLTRNNKFEGILWLDSDETYAYTESDAQYIAQMAYQTVIAVDNTRLFQRVTKNRDNLQTILNGMEEAIMLIDQDSNIIMANPRMNLLGLDGAELQQKSISTIMQTHPHFCQCIGFTMSEITLFLDKVKQETLGHADVFYQYTLFEDPAQTTHIHRQIIPLQGDAGDMTGALLVFYNKTKEYELARARDSFSQMIVHDLRSPLAAVTTSLRLLAELVPTDVPYRPTIDKTLDNSRRAVRKVLNRVNALLDIAKMESGEMVLDCEPTPILPLLRNVISELNPLALELGITLEIKNSNDTPFFDIDADKVERMLLNFVDNALKYTPMDSYVYISVQTIMHDDQAWGQIDIIDQGPGIPDEYKTRLFERFVQIDGRRTSRHGVGLGLTFCKLVAESHGGQITIYDNPEGGSIFSVRLPIVTETAE